MKDFFTLVNSGVVNGRAAPADFWPGWTVGDRRCGRPSQLLEGKPLKREPGNRPQPAQMVAAPRACHHHISRRCRRPFFWLARRRESSVVTLHKRPTTQPGGKMAPARRVVPEKAPLSVARRSFGVTKPRSSRLDWCIFRRNSDDLYGDGRSLMFGVTTGNGSNVRATGQKTQEVTNGAQS